MDGDREKFIRSKNAKTKAGGASIDKFQIFEMWLLDNGTKFPKLELKDYGDEVRGCHAVKAIEEEEIIVEVPLRCLITVEMGKETRIGRAILDSSIELDAPKHIFLMVFMLIDRKDPSSFFAPYYDILPPTLNNMPIFWSPSELKCLEGSYMLEQIEERNAAISADYKAICKVVPQFSLVATLEEFKWARMCVCSRNFGLIVNGVRTAALVPYADMLNHYRPRETKWQYEDASQAFTIVSLQGINPGAQVYDSYGQKCNHRFLLNYGFSVENNVEPDGYCPNELKSTDPLYDQKCNYWRGDGSLPGRRVRVSVCENENSRILLSLLRIIEADMEDFERLTLAGGNSTMGVGPGGRSGSRSYRSIQDALVPISVRNEMRAMKHLKKMCDDCLAAYPNTYEHDCVRLADNSSPPSLTPFSNERHALIQVRGEKEVLLFYKDYALSAIRLLEIKEDGPFEVELAAVWPTKHMVVQQYLSNTLCRLRQDEKQRAEMRVRNVDFSRPTVV